MTIYFVKQGDTVYSIARQYGVSPARLISDNQLDATDSLVVGQTIVIQIPDSVYTVSQGDTLNSIAEENGLTVSELLRNNPSLKGKSNVYPGQTLVLSYQDPPEVELSVNGYAYPFIDPDTFTETLPYLSSFTVFTYGFTEQGELIEPEDADILSTAQGAEASPILLISTLNENGAFSNELGSVLLGNEALQNTLIEQIIAEMRNKGYLGLDIDFEYVSASDRDNYTNFVSRAREALNPLGYPVIVALAPKVRADQPGLLYEGHDYPALGQAADYVLLMTYEWGYTFGPLNVSEITQIYCAYILRRPLHIVFHAQSVYI